MENKLDFQKCKQFLDKLISLLKSQFVEDLLAIALFGSVARGEGTRESDLDLLIVHRQGKEALHKFVQILPQLRCSEEYQALESQGFYPDPFPIFMDEARLRDHPWVLLDVMDHGIILWDKGKILRNELEAVRENLKHLGGKKVVLENGTWYWDLKPDWKPGEVIEL